MHAAIYRTRMTEDTFQILLDVMERHFAALSLPDPASDPKITRAISFSELPSSRRILIEQCYRADDSGTLVKQYSCEQIFEKISNSRELKVSEIVRTGSEHCLSNTWRTKLPVTGSFGNASWHKSQIGRVIRSIEPENHRKMESMEIEEIDVKPIVERIGRKPSNRVPVMELNGMSLSDAKAGDRALIKASTFGNMAVGGSNIFAKPTVRSRSVSPKKLIDRAIKTEPEFLEILQTPEVPKDNKKIDYNETKKKLRSLIPDEATIPQKSRFFAPCYKFVFFILLTLSIAILAIFIHDDNATRRNAEKFDITNMSLELKVSLYGQDRAIERLVEQLRDASSGINLVALIGGTGVGKSFAVGIVAKHFSYPNNVFEYVSPLRKNIHEAFTALSGRNCNLVLLENLRIADLSDVASFVKFMIEHTRQLCVVTIAIFNPQETGNDLDRRYDVKKSVDLIAAKFHKEDLPETKIIVFENLDERSIEACINRAAREKNVVLKRQQLMEIRENLMTVGSGCKGSYARVQLLNES